MEVPADLPFPKVVSQMITSLLRWSPAAIAVLGHDQRPILTSPALSHLTDLPAETLCQRDYRTLFVPDQVAALEEFLRGEATAPHCATLANGRLVEVKTYPVEFEEHRWQVVVLLDITQERLLLAKLSGLSQFVASLTYAGSLNATLNRLCQRTVENSRAVASAIILEEHQKFRIQGLFGLDSAHLPVVEAALNSGVELPPHRALARGEFIVEPNLKHSIDGLRDLANPEVMALIEVVRQQSWNTVICLPIHSNGVVVAVLNCYYTDEAQLDQAEKLYLQTLADLAAVAIENARLLDQAQEKAALEERQRLARELHDSVAQAIYGASLGLKTAQVQLERDPALAKDPVNYSLDLVEAATKEMRALIFSLRPESLEQEGLIRALLRHIEVMKVRYRIEVRAQLPAEPPLDSDQRYALFRVATEALHNIVKHAQVSQSPAPVSLTLTVDTSSVQLRIQDYGVGFDPSKPLIGHFGLKSMRERIENLGGHFQVESQPGQGCSLLASLPRQKILVS